MINNRIKNVQTMIGVDMVIDGSVKLENAINVYGQIKGGIKTKGSVRLGKSAAVYGDIIGEDIRIAGLVEGNILSKGQVTLLKTCKVSGDVTYKKLIINNLKMMLLARLNMTLLNVSHLLKSLIIG